MKTRPATKPKPTFFPVNIVADRKVEMTSSCALKIILENGIRIGVREGFNAQEAGRLIEVLRAC